METWCQGPPNGVVAVASTVNSSPSLILLMLVMGSKCGALKLGRQKVRLLTILWPGVRRGE